MPNKTSPHILNTATNLLGFCLFVITSLHISNYAVTSVIDEFTSIISVVLILSGMLSFSSIRTNNENLGNRLEKIAEYLFAFALLGVFAIVVLLTLHFIK